MYFIDKFKINLHYELYNFRTDCCTRMVYIFTSEHNRFPGQNSSPLSALLSLSSQFMQMRFDNFRRYGSPVTTYFRLILLNNSTRSAALASAIVFARPILFDRGRFNLVYKVIMLGELITLSRHKHSP
jgi:hypothetical protein